MAYRKSKRSKRLVSKNGKVNWNNKKNIAELKDAILKSSEYTDREKDTLINKLDALVKNRSENGKSLTVNGFFGKYVEDNDPEIRAIRRLLRNAGYSPEEAAEELDIDVKDILKKENWKDDTFTYKGKSYTVQFNYTTSIFKED